MSTVEKIKHLFYLGDVREKLLEIPEKSVQCVVTSPPYWGLRDYGLPPSVWGDDPECVHEWDGFIRDGQSCGKKSKKVQIKGRDNFQIVSDSGQAVCQKCGAWLGCLGLEPTPELYVKHMVEIFRGVWRVLRDDGVVWLNLGDSYAGGGGIQGVPKDWKSISTNNRSKYPDNNDPKRNAKAIGLKFKDLVGIPWRVAFALQADGWYLRSDIIWAKPNLMPESVTDRPTKAHEYIFLLTKKQKYFYDAEAIKEDAMSNGPRGENLYNDTKKGPHGGKERWKGDRKNDWAKNGRNKRSVWTVATRPYPEAHFATFPPKLIEPCILAGTSPRACEICSAPWERVVERIGGPKGDPTKEFGRCSTTEAMQATGRTGRVGGATLAAAYAKYGYLEIKTTGWQPTCTCQNEGKGRCIVLDPFAGSGTTNLVAQTLGRDSIYIDRSKKYLNMALKRLGLQEQKLKRMLDTVQFQIFGAKEGDEL